MLGVKHARVDEIGRLIVAPNNEDFSGLASTGRGLDSLKSQESDARRWHGANVSFVAHSGIIYRNAARRHTHASPHQKKYRTYHTAVRGSGDDPNQKRTRYTCIKYVQAQV